MSDSIKPLSATPSLLDRAVQIMAEAELHQETLDSIRDQEIRQINALAVEMASYLGNHSDPTFPLRPLEGSTLAISALDAKERPEKLWLICPVYEVHDHRVSLPTPKGEDISNSRRYLALDRSGHLLEYNRSRGGAIRSYKSVYSAWTPELYHTDKLRALLADRLVQLESHHRTAQERLAARAAALTR